MNTKLQVTLRNGKNADKLFDNVSDIFKVYTASQVQSINEIVISVDDKKTTGITNKRGKQFAVRAGKVY